MTDEYTHYTVGGMFVEGRTEWPDIPHLWLEADSVRLGLFLPDPQPDEIESVNTGKARFGWVERQFTGYLVFRYGDFPWTYAGFSPHQLSEPFPVELMPRGTHMNVYTFLVGNRDGRIYAMRGFSWPAYFVNTIVASVNRLAARPYSVTAARAEQDQLNAAYPTGPALHRLVRSEALATCLGGQRADRPI